MPIQIQSARQLCQTNGVKVLVFANAGAGKTTLIATAPIPIILSAESGLLALNQVMKQRNIDFPVITISTMTDLIEALSYFENDPSARQFSTVCLDSASEIAEVVLKNEKARTKDPRKAYGELIEIMSAIIRRFRDLQGYNVYVSAKLDHQKDDLTGQITKGPAMPGRVLGPSMPYFFDEVYYLYTTNDANGQKIRALQTDGDLQVPCCKSRAGVLAPVELPDLTYIFNKIIQG